jgi:integrase
MRDQTTPVKRGRPSSGAVVERQTSRGTVYAIRFSAYGRRRYVTLDADTRQQAELALQDVLADVRRGIWQAPVEPDPAPAEQHMPTFHTFASEWWSRYEHEWAPRTREQYAWALSGHVLPFFRDFPLDRIAVQDVDRFKSMKVREREQDLVDRPLSNVSINKAIAMLSRILDEAVEYGLIDRNPAKGRRRRLKANPRPHAWLEPDEVDVLIASAGRNRALVATLIRAGLRVGEACALTWGAVDLVHDVIRVGSAKTPAGVREVHISDALHAELIRHRSEDPGVSSALVFTTKLGTPQTRHNVNRRVLRSAVKAANAELARQERPPINPRLTPHSLRHTFASLLLESGATVPYVMAQMGHADPKLVLTIYGHVLARGQRVQAGRAADALTSFGTSARNPGLTAVPTTADSA